MQQVKAERISFKRWVDSTAFISRRQSFRNDILIILKTITGFHTNTEGHFDALQSIAAETITWRQRSIPPAPKWSSSGCNNRGYRYANRLAALKDSFSLGVHPEKRIRSLRSIPILSSSVSVPELRTSTGRRPGDYGWYAAGMGLERFRVQPRSPRYRVRFDPPPASIAAEKGYSIYLLGAMPGLRPGREVLQQKHPNLKIAGSNRRQSRRCWKWTGHY
jgi:hypothetical protein